MKVLQKLYSDEDPTELILTTEAEVTLVRILEMVEELKTIQGVSITCQITAEVDQSLLCGEEERVPKAIQLEQANYILKRVDDNGSLHGKSAKLADKYLRRFNLK